MKTRIISIPKVEDMRGNLGIIEGNTLPFPIKRVYYLFDVPSSASRGGHAHKEQLEFLISISGSFDVLIDDGSNKERITLNKPDKGLLIPTKMWRELDNFSSGAVCLVISSGEFDEDDYIRNYDSFIKYTSNCKY
ncbi:MULTISPECIES: FdtA/QdtA family cupin domain-containing protein [Flavobacterium]|uniref:TDP-4-oxo-6-deoxy-alpha-D-glucose-3, 4-oxoisomerase n=2 Tax=Flavobacterium TaxID=237 RepID=A0A2N9PDU1_9FLAO|nr:MULTISPECIES: FdtA/QdtA family cupin domain-containing protein [Flavobacterium]QYS89021.1 WxcM-like domain-containing protein [Flavobacterium davisii]RVU90255.1 WxcM-like domain-containing protein [Flavobacterium columnare]SPE78514.1 TDP-4-oxo-6-deoxy-alpha-D-glucose-3, 4-oxoisomerase [Flavobacterium columnare]